MILTDEVVNNLRASIMIQAVNDYKDVICGKPVRKYKTVKRRKIRLTKEEIKFELEQRKNELEKFFQSSWCEQLTDIDGRYIMSEIKKRCKK